MNKVVREHYPTAKLPDDLRAGFAHGATVRITIESEQTTPRRSFDKLRQDIEAARRADSWPSTTAEEAAARIRALRDEWDG